MNSDLDSCMIFYTEQKYFVMFRQLCLEWKTRELKISLIHKVWYVIIIII